jgi:DNA-binding HxlR family transcriptional regulator
MKCNGGKLAILEQRHALRMLSCLYANGRFQRSTLYSSIARTTTAPMKRVNELISMGLITETITDGAPFTKHVELSEQGKRVAKHVVEIEKILSEEH